MNIKVRKLVALLCAFTLICSGTTTGFAVTDVNVAASSSSDVVEKDVLMTTEWNYFDPKDKSDLTEKIFASKLYLSKTY